MKLGAGSGGPAAAPPPVAQDGFPSPELPGDRPLGRLDLVLDVLRVDAERRHEAFEGSLQFLVRHSYYLQMNVNEESDTQIVWAIVKSRRGYRRSQCVEL